ncbi:uncharacterized protein LOC117229277 [Megalopta genalis]|uniref:uncharacterized protein LOC117229277 n=1 Tax=Megalopta genalis TaxID=115081 RepID=UPI0014438376|nr:uncharacterized protein LOC117229277 [Megalopta genalis]
MRSRVNVVAVLLTLSCVVRLLETSRSAVRYQEQNLEKIVRKDHVSAGKKVLVKGPQNKVTPNTAVLLLVEDKNKPVKKQTKNNDLPASKDYLTGGGPRRKMQKMDRTMMALLIAYKMKFVALIPTMVGGLILLKATALLAGFFFALFAAVLGLKVH